MGDVKPEDYDNEGFWREHDEQKPVVRKTDSALWLEAVEEAEFFKTLSKPVKQNYEQFTYIGSGSFGMVFRAMREGKQYAVKLFFDKKSGYLEAIREVSVLLYLKKLAMQNCLASTPHGHAEPNDSLHCCPDNIICYTDHFRARLDSELALFMTSKVNFEIDLKYEFYFIESKFLSGNTIHDVIKARMFNAQKQIREHMRTQRTKENLEEGVFYSPQSEEIREVYTKFGPTKEQNLSMMHTALVALEFMHRHGAFHRDIHTANIILLNKESERPESVLLDVGTSCVKNECVDLIGHGAYGLHRLANEARILLAAHTLETSKNQTEIYTAQHVLMMAGILKRNLEPVKTMSQGRLSRLVEAAIDVYALGTVFYYYLSGIFPRWTDDFEPRKRPSKEKPGANSEMWELVEDMINIDIPLRETAARAKQRAFDMLSAETSRKTQARASRVES